MNFWSMFFPLSDRNRAPQCWMCLYEETEEKQPMSDLFNPLAPRITLSGGRLLGASRMRHEKHTQSSNNQEALALPNNTAAAADLLPASLNSHWNSHHPQVLTYLRLYCRLKTNCLYYWLDPIKAKTFIKRRTSLSLLHSTGNIHDLLFTLSIW